MNQLIEKKIEIENSNGKVFEVPRVMVVGSERFFPGQIVEDLASSQPFGQHLTFVKERAARFLRNLLCERESTDEYNKTEVDMTRVVGRLLKSDFWPNTVRPNSSYTRHSDVVNGVTVTVTFDDFSSGRVYLNGRVAMFSYEKNPNVRKALLVLAEAIRLDNEAQQNNA